MSPARPKITVIGSINMDLVVRCRQLPTPGQTILATSSKEICGGKGANQAVAAARAGGDVTMIGRIGDDAFADRLLQNLQREQIDCAVVLPTEGIASGIAVVAVEDSGQNAIMVVPGANGQVRPEDIQAARQQIAESDVVMVQLEIPMDAVLAAIDLARQAGVRCILDPAPAPSTFPETLLHVDLICPNESEAESLTGISVSTMEDAQRAARELHRRGTRQVVITLGDRGCLYFDGEQAHVTAARRVDAVDTTAAGDAFAGALAVQWAATDTLVNAIPFAAAAGALSASRAGAQPSLPRRAEIETEIETR